ncbi:MAG: penicillin acylase family protein [Pyrinomonadaceae bacterium]
MKRLFFVPAAVILLSIISFGQSNVTKVTVAGLKDEVTIRRDGRGIPYIEAKSDADLYFAQGYVMASDRLFQMDSARRLARGQTAELSGEARLEEDKRWRRFGFASLVEQSLASMSPETRAPLDDYARGVNAYIATLDDRTMPPEFKILQYKPAPWLPTDSLIIGAILADSLSSTWRLDLIRASLAGIDKQKLADLTNQVTPYDVVLFGKDSDKTTAETRRRREDKDKQGENSSLPLLLSASAVKAFEKDEQLRKNSLERIGLYAEDLAASNNWVISGKRTADGRAMLANDPHLAPAAPGIWYLIDLRSPTHHVAGVTFPGNPGVTIGHNDYIAWGMTNVGPDAQDLYVETFNDAGEYKTPTGWAKPVIRKETINVRTNISKPETAPQTIDVMETRNGVVITDDAGKKYALKWTARDPKNLSLDAFQQLNRAKDWKSFETALKKFGGPAHNFVYADVKGNIGWHIAGAIPTRKTGEGALPYDGSTTDGDWTGEIPFDELPHLYNPPSGFIVTANQRTVGTDYKYPQMIRAAATPWRARRIYDRLSKLNKATMDDSRDIQHDAYAIPLAMLAKTLFADGSVSAETLAVLKDWDGKMTPDSRAAVLTNEIRNCIGNKMAEENKPVPAFLIQNRILERAVEEKLTRWLPSPYKTYGELYKACDANARTSLAANKTYGADPNGWVWGKTFMSRFAHPLAAVPFIGGQFATPNVGISGSGFTPNVGSSVSMRLIASPGNWDATRHVIPLGQSGDPRSPHYKDQFESWRTGSPSIFPFSKEAVKKSTVEIIILTNK